uniref:Polyprotein protein n=1 Tax=Solanum tuberosum TaxID=4113 RepID=M1D8V9_SOLTU
MELDIRWTAEQLGERDLDYLKSQNPEDEELRHTDNGLEQKADHRPGWRDAESEAETDEEELGVRDAAMYVDLADLEGAIVETAVQTSLRDYSMLGSNGANDTSEPGTDVQTYVVTDM